MAGSPTAKRRVVASELRRLREACRLTAAEAARQVGIHQSTLSRIEDAASGLRLVNVRALLDLYGVDDEAREALLALAASSNERGWWETYGVVLPRWFESFVGLEAGASRIRCFATHAVPGLMQTREYARAVLRSGQPDASDAEIDRQVEVRLRRQARLASEPVSVLAILGEAVLWCCVGDPTVMRAQLAHLLALSARPNVGVQILPFRRTVYVAIGKPFVLLDFESPRDVGLVYFEYGTGALYLDRPAEVDAHRIASVRLLADALSPEESRRMIEDAAQRLD